MRNKYTVLYVDDEPINLQLFELSLSVEYDILTASSGEEGLSVLEKNKNICVVVSDMRMPGMNGLEFIKTAKNKYPAISYFILTGFDITDAIAEAIKENLIIKYFNKPFNISDIKMSINENATKGCY